MIPSSGRLIVLMAFISFSVSAGPHKSPRCWETAGNRLCNNNLSRSGLSTIVWGCSLEIKMQNANSHKELTSKRQVPHDN